MPHSAFKIRAGECDSIEGRLIFSMKNGKKMTITARRDSANDLWLYCYSGTDDMKNSDFQQMRLSKCSIELIVSNDDSSSDLPAAITPEGV
jgi:hypothetical protein